MDKTILETTNTTETQQNHVQTTQNNSDVCNVCGKTTKKSIEILGIKKTVHVICDCEKIRLEKEKTELELSRKQQEIKKLKLKTMLGKRYQGVCFDATSLNISQSFNKAYLRCKKYCENYEETIENGYGIYLHGDKGTGKTHLTACMANYLLSKRVPVLFTNLFEISNSVRSTFSKYSSQTQSELVERISSVPILFFDDLGSEIFVKNSNETWIQSLLFDLINKRYNNQKATVFSSNYCLNDLINARGIYESTIDRICEMTNGAVIRITGKSMRMNTSKNLPF